MSTQIGIAAYLRNLAVRLNQIAKKSSDLEVRTQIEKISAELADKAQVLEETFKVEPYRQT